MIQNPIKALREIREWTQQETANRVGVTWQTIWNLEKGRVRTMKPKTIQGLGRVFETDPGMLEISFLYWRLACEQTAKKTGERSL